MSRLFILLTITFLNLSCTEKKIKIQAYMSPSCGCCKKWVSHLEDNGFEVESVFRENMRAIKSKYNISQGELEKAKELLLSIPSEKRLSFHNFQIGKIYKIMGLSKKAENYFKKSHKQAKLWAKPLVELASIAMLNSKFDYSLS